MSFADRLLRRTRIRSRRHGTVALVAGLLATSALAGETMLVSAAIDGTTGDASSGTPFGGQSISANGRFVSFESVAEDLVAADENEEIDVFVRDLKKGTTVRASVALDGDPAKGSGMNASLSANGRYVAFQSASLDLVGNDGNPGFDIFVRDLKKGVTTVVSVTSAGDAATGNSFNPFISASGRFVAFQSEADDLVAGDVNASTDIFVHDRKKGTTTRVSVDSAGLDDAGESFSASVSANGRYVAFESIADELVEGDRNAAGDVFLRDLKLGATVRLSLNADDVEGDDPSHSPMISANGRWVAFASTARNLTGGDDGNDILDVFVRDLKKGTVERISVDAAGDGGDGGSGGPWITPSGRHVAFESGATNLVPDDLNTVSDTILVDRKKATRQRVSLDSAGAEADGASQRCAVSSNGRFVAFDSGAENLVSPKGSDDNDSNDVFVRDLK